MNRLLVLFISYLVLSLALPGLVGCAGDQPAALVEQGEPIGAQLLRAVPALKSERFSTLLDFESNDDEIFCTSVGGKGAIDHAKPHTGRGSFKIDPSVTRISVKLNSLLAGRPFPGEWTLAGGYFYCEHPTKVTANFAPVISGAEPRTVDLEAGKWTAVFVALPAVANLETVPSLTFDLESPHEPVWCDDVMLIDNYKLLTGPTPRSMSTAAPSDVPGDPAGDVTPPWTIIRRGLTFDGSAPGRFNFQLQTNESTPDEWLVDEANPMRARFHTVGDASVRARTLTIYSDGRAYWDGQYKPMSTSGRDPALAAEHLSPAHIEVTEGMGRVDRNTPGDANNDGYNETTGSYRIIATGPRIELRFIPNKCAVLSPVLEFSGLPFGKPLITLEGRLVEESTRTSSGTLLVELPANIDRAVTVNVRIEE
jgi:hypothetical protein